jgi:hypothetical protein
LIGPYGIHFSYWYSPPPQINFLANIGVLAPVKYDFPLIRWLPQ